MATKVTLDYDVSDVPGVNLPVTDPRSYVLVDNDAQTCRVISDADLRASYVDNNMDTFRLQDIDWLTLDVDNQYVSIKNTTGAATALQLRSIHFGAPGRTDQYGQIRWHYLPDRFEWQTGA